MCGFQQPVEDIDVDEPVSVHGAVPAPVGTAGCWLCTVMSGKGLRPPVASSVDPMGMPTRPTVERELRPGDEADAVGLEDAVVVLLAHVPEAVPDRPVLSNRGVGAVVAPVIALLVLAIEVPGLELPGLEHAVAAVIE